MAVPPPPTPKLPAAASSSGQPAPDEPKATHGLGGEHEDELDKGSTANTGSEGSSSVVTQGGAEQAPA